VRSTTPAAARKKVKQLRQLGHQLRSTTPKAAGKRVKQLGQQLRSTTPTAARKKRVKQLREQGQQLAQRIPPNLKIKKKLQVPGSQESGKSIHRVSIYIIDRLPPI
jgi:hypothetical protein